jgi:DNA mismatch endonuclease, patch repair protein
VADVVDKAKRSQMMAGIQGKNTKPEMTIRKALHAAGIRYRLHVADLPGKPDLVFPKYKAAVLVHGCFWHRHRNCWWCTNPSTNEAFWSAKFDENVRRDEKNLTDLENLGWRVATVWECALRIQAPTSVADTVRNWLEGSARRLILPAEKDERLAPLAAREGGTSEGRRGETRNIQMRRKPTGSP